MKNRSSVFFLLFALSSSMCAAQGPTFGRPGTPTTSPYLNLIRGSNLSPALNYYRSYKPEIEFRANEQRLNKSVAGLKKDVATLQASEKKQTSYLGTTGHSTSFHSYGSYFPRR